MSRRSYQRGDKILLDTSFLLPVLGFETSERVMKAFQKLGSHELYYNDISILEALWKIVKVVKGAPEEVSRIQQGVTAIKDTMRHAPITGDAVVNAIRMYMLGHRDMIDNLLLSTAITMNLKLLTVDKELIDFAKRHSLDGNIITPEELD